jgi:hypothetical protein
MADTGGAALQAFERQPQDVVVAEMAALTPGGTDLLLEVSERWPSCSRIGAYAT